MKVCIPQSIRLITFIILSIHFVFTSFAQRISIIPQVDSLNFVGSCTPPGMICELKESSYGIDTIIIHSEHGDPLCTGYPPIQANMISSFNFVIRDSLNQFHYELWIRPSLYYNSQKLGFDTVYGFSPQLYWLVLQVFSGNDIVDSVKIKLNVVQTGLAVEDHSINIPNNISLEQNYPNPFNPATTIRFSIPSKLFVSLKVFDVLGRGVSTLLSEELTSGTYSQRWHAKDLPSGIYFYRLQTSSFLETKKLILLR